jgi:hypothetical protein
MRARILLLALTGLLAASLAMAKPGKAPPPLRGPEATSPTAAAPPATSAQPLPPLPIAAAYSPIPPPTQADIDQCRMACSHTYYFCSAGSDTDDCAPSWTSCRAKCEAPRDGQTGTQPLPGVR